MVRKFKIVFLAMILAVSFCSAAFAGLSAVGPINPTPAPGNGFPQWYKDANGVVVELPIPPIGAPPPAVVIPTMIFSAVDPNFPYSAQTGFGAEAFYFNATSPKTFQTAWGKVTVLLGLEASYANLVPTEGQQVVFSRIRVTAPNIQVAGTYKLFHPWGVETINVASADLIQNKGKGIKFTKDFGLSPGWNPNGTGGFVPVAAPGGFFTVLQAGNTMSTFLQAVNPAPPAQWIGDGVTPATFTGSPIAYNKIRLEAPVGTNLDGKGNNFIESTQMVISGHIPLTTITPLALSVDRMTCSHIGAVENIDYWITSRPGATVTINDVNPANNALGAVLHSGTVTDINGKFYATFPGTSKLVAVTVADPTGAFSPATKTVAVTDAVSIISATYSEVNAPGTLTIQATSSDYFFTTKRALPPPVLTATGFGNLAVIDTVNGIYSLSVPAPIPGILPPTITVTSSVGGSATVLTGMAP